MITPDELISHQFPERRHAYGAREAMLYAAGIGFGFDPADERQLPFIYEEQLRVVPSMATVIATPGFWQRDPAFGIDWQRILHGEQGIVLEKPLPIASEVIGKFRIVAIVDKGPDKGLSVFTEREIIDAVSGELLSRLPSTVLFRGNGGAGSAGTPPVQPEPEDTSRPPDFVCELRTSPQAAVIYRLSGDYNPIHVDPKAARAAGFERPIMHGLGTFGTAMHAILRSVCDYDVSLVRSMHARFSAPTFPGETIRTEIWQNGNVVNFRCTSLPRNIVCLSNGRVELR